MAVYGLGCSFSIGMCYKRTPPKCDGNTGHSLDNRIETVAECMFRFKILNTKNYELVGNIWNNKSLTYLRTNLISMFVTKRVK